MPTLTHGLHFLRSRALTSCATCLLATLAFSGAVADEPTNPMIQTAYCGKLVEHSRSVFEGTSAPIPPALSTAAQDIDYTVRNAETFNIPVRLEADDRTASRLRVLQKPLREIDFERQPESARAPASAAYSLKPASLVSFAEQPFGPRSRYAIAARHNPLYFEEFNLERCGYTLGCAQTFVSACHFFGNALALPYRAVERPWCSIECDRLDCRSAGRLP